MKAIFAAAAAIALTGCASIVSESDYPVSVSSTPAGANYEIRNERGMIVSSGVTPGQVILKAGAGYFDGERYTVNYRKDGYVDQEAIIDSELDGWYWGNIIFGGLIGMLAVDPATGAMYKLPAHVGAGLAPSSSLASAVVQPENKQEKNERTDKDRLLNELSNDKSISYEEYKRRHEIIMRSH